MTKPSSSPWRTILTGLLFGLIVTLLAIFGPSMLGFPGSPYLILVALLVAAIAVAIKIPKRRTLTISMIVGGLIGVAASFVALIAFLSDGFFSTRSEENLSAPQLEQWVGLDLPSSATNLHSYAEGFQDWQVFVRFEMPKSDLNEFLRVNKLEPESNTITYFSNDDVKKDWWKPELNKSQVFKPMVKDEAETQPTTKTGFYPTIQISELENGLVTVYISAFNT